MTVVIADTSPINYLVLIKHVAILQQLYQIVVLPSAVYAELTATGTPPVVRDWVAALPDWIEVREPREISQPAITGLDAGERAAILLACAETDVLLLIDDAAGRAVATELRVPHTGTLGVLQAAARMGLIDLREALHHLQRTNFRISESLILRMLAAQIAPGVG